MDGKFLFKFDVIGTLTTSFIKSFRNSFPYFADTTKYTDARISFYQGLSEAMMDKDIWGDLYDYGVQLFIAHNLIAEDMRLLVINGGANSGVGPVSSTLRSVDGVTYSNKYMMGYYRNAGFWATSTYGQEYYDLMMLVGMRPTQFWNKVKLISAKTSGII